MNQRSGGFGRRKIVKIGHYFRTSDETVVQRFKCQNCGRGFSEATHEFAYRQKKRQINFDVFIALSSSTTQRRMARNMTINRKTVQRKLIYLAVLARFLLPQMNQAYEKSSEIEFDDLETFEHTKCKPLSVTLAVQTGSRRILGLEVSQMPCNGPLAEISREKYGARKDERKTGREQLFNSIGNLVKPNALIKSDQNPHYPADVKRHFPGANHQTFKGRKPAHTGQGEMKKGRFDPLFSLNHTCAMLRADISRLVRKTWSTTKKRERLSDHLAIYAVYHNIQLERRKKGKSNKGPTVDLFKQIA